jgi:propionate CoA-transferase
MGFRSAMADNLRDLDPRLFADAPVGLEAELARKAPRVRSRRLEKLEGRG